MGLGVNLGVNALAGSATAFTNEYSVAFDGVNDWAENLTYSALDGATSFSISFWIKPLDTINRWCFRIYSATTPIQMICRVAGGTEYIDVSMGTTSYFGRSSVGSVPANTWTHVLWTADLSLSRYSKYELYINGVDDLASNAGGGVTSLGAFDSLWVGRSTSGPTNATFYGHFEEVAIWKNTILSPTDAAAIYHGGAPTDLNNNGLTAPTNWYRMGDGDTYPTLTDHGSSGDDLTMINMDAGDIVTDVPT